MLLASRPATLAATLLWITCLLPLTAQAEFSRTFLDAQPASTITSDEGVTIAYKDIGSPEEPAAVLVMGLGASHAVWGDDLVLGLRQAGYRVVMLDNRDVGDSSRFTEFGDPVWWWQMFKSYVGLEVDAAYTLDDMGNDVVLVMDDLAIAQAHLIGASMGGMISQVIAVNHPDRLLTLTSIMSTTGARHLPPPSAETSDRFTDFAEGRTENSDILARGFYLDSIPRQLAAIIKAGDRSDAVAGITVPTLVLHGADDTLLPPEHGKHTAQMIKGSTLKIFPGMGHNFPDTVLPDLLAMIIDHMN